MAIGIGCIKTSAAMAMAAWHQYARGGTMANAHDDGRGAI
eukprot:CAMPEP_0202900326 /NCGR_PEP_ID=MMETSP1392-20130828/11134_1 /ASSEMBLY_ACC=CAM_ASM_000868 /TAXON_ID=225041 /ORGANISM="Chlamydomonas chlamydogama, Strain SAG 11-48b" /LENGTH=39 /DNA_ID= /DNA_START= /DNA_END= /DNA_ORIENTATION=